MERNLPTVSVAFADTGHYNFMGTGMTPELAVASLTAAWRTHCAQTPYADPDWLTDDAIHVMTGRVGTAYRDWDVYPKLPARPEKPEADPTNPNVARLLERARQAAETRDVHTVITAFCDGTASHIEFIKTSNAVKWYEGRRQAGSDVTGVTLVTADLHIGRGEHANCTATDHDREPGESEQATGEDGLMVCNDCARRLFYCANTGRYHHVDPNAPACWLTTNC